MVKFVAQDPSTGRLKIGLGINEGNLERLRMDQPIRVRLDDPAGLNINLEIDILLFFKPTMDGLVAEVLPHTDEYTVVHADMRIVEEALGILKQRRQQSDGT